VNLEFKDWAIIVSFGLTIVTGWVRLKYRIDRSDEIHGEIKEALVDLALSIKPIGEDIGEIKTSVAVLTSEQGNLKSRVDKLEA